jgi:hypothetical protein
MAYFALVTSHNMSCQVLCFIPLYSLSVFITCITWTQNMPRHDKVKINRANGQTGGKKFAAVLMYWLHSFLLACLIFSQLAALGVNMLTECSRTHK